jgi:hypothetical protein
MLLTSVSSFKQEREGDGSEGGQCTVLGVGLEVEMVDWIGHTANLAYGCCCSGMFNRCCKCTLEEEQERCEKG